MPSLFGLGRATVLFLCVSAALFLLAGGSGHLGPFWPRLLTFAGLILVPLLSLIIYQCVRTGLLGLTEYSFGLLYQTSGFVPNLDTKTQVHHLLGLLYSGTGRLDKALHFYKRSQATRHIFASTIGSAWVERDRLPELLYRMGRHKDAVDLALLNVQKCRRDLIDAPSKQARENLQCNLIVAWQLDKQNNRQVFLREAIDLAEDNNLGHYASGLLEKVEGRSESALTAFEQCRASILEARKSAVSIRDSELLNACNLEIARIYLAANKLDNIAPIIQIMEKENQSEPPLATDVITLAWLKADCKIAAGDRDGALKIINNTIAVRSRRGAQYDHLLTLTEEKYSTIGGETSDSANKKTMSGDSNKTPAPLPGLPGQAARLPDLSATRNIANNSVIIFILLTAYIVSQMFFLPGQTHPVLAVSICLIAMIICVRNVREQVLQRKSNVRAARTLQSTSPIDIALTAAGQKLPGVSMKNCVITDGPDNLIGRKLEIAVNDNLAFASLAADAAGGTLKARIYIDQENAISKNQS